VSGFLARGGSIGLRRLGVSFGYGPQGRNVATANGTPRTRGDVVLEFKALSIDVSFGAKTTELDPQAAGDEGTLLCTAPAAFVGPTTGCTKPVGVVSTSSLSVGPKVKKKP